MGNITRHVFAVVMATVAWGSAWAAQNEAGLLTEGAQFQESRIELMRGADKSISMRYFMWKGDRAGLIHMAELWAAAERGVQVRIIMDGRKRPEDFPEELISVLLSHPNIQIKMYNEVNFWHLGRATYRQHDKFAIFESHQQTEALVGDVQPTNWHCRNATDLVRPGDSPSLSVDVYLRGPVTSSIQSYFNDSWYSKNSTTLEPRVKLTPAIKRKWVFRLKQLQIDAHTWLTKSGWRQKIKPVLNAEFLHDNNEVPKSKMGAVAGRVLSEINRSSREVKIVSQYIIPTSEMRATLADAKKRKVDIEFLTNSKKSLVGKAIYYFTRANHQLLADLGTTVGEWQGPEYLHMKLSVFDQSRTYVGSMHWDPRAQNLNNETGVLIDDPAFARSALTLYSRLKGNSQTIIDHGTLQIPRPFLSTCLWLFTPIAIRNQM